TTSTKAEQALADLALGMATARSHQVSAIRLLRSAAAGLRKTNFVVFEAQAHLWLALVCLSSGRNDLAGKALNEGSEGISGLGAAGWKFLLCDSENTHGLRALWDSASSPLRLKFLGRQEISLNGVAMGASLRTCELLTLISESESGIEGERLRLAVFGDDSTIANVKASVSRLRRLFPISRSPYRLTGRVQSDFRELIQSVERGDLNQALSLYVGQLLPHSDAPGVVELRNHIDEEIRTAVVSSGDVELMIKLGTIMEGELEVWEAARSMLPPGDSRRGLVNARIRRI